MNPPQLCRWHLYASTQAMHDAASAMIAQAAERAIARTGRFDLVLAGGSTPRALYQQLRQLKTDWRAWHIYFGDERCLPVDHAGRNSGMAHEAWLAHVAIPAGQIHPIHAEMGAQQAAQAYSSVLAGVEEFDLVLLGVGEDGHTASLFPGRDWGREPQAPPVLAVFDAPKPPAERVSLSAWRLASARQVLFLVSGENKREAVLNWRAGANIPARAISPAHGVDVLAEKILLED